MGPATSTPTQNRSGRCGLSNEIICVHHDRHRAALVLHWGSWIPAELCLLYAEVIHALRDAGRCVVQTSNLQGDNHLACVRELLLRALRRAIELGATDLVTVVSPRHARGYCLVFQFEDMLPDGPPRPWDLARDESGALLPTRLVRLTIDKISPHQLRTFDGGQDASEQLR